MEKNIILPEPKEGFEYVLAPKPMTVEEHLIILNYNLKKYNIPIDKELIELGKTIHPYYEILEMIESLEKQISIKKFNIDHL